MAGQKSPYIEDLEIPAPQGDVSQAQKEEPVPASTGPVPLNKLAHPTGARRQAEWARRMQHRLGNDAVQGMLDSQPPEQAMPTPAELPAAEVETPPAPEPPLAAAASAQAHQRAKAHAADIAPLEGAAPASKAAPGGPLPEAAKAPKLIPEETRPAPSTKAPGTPEDQATGAERDIVMWRASAVRAAKNIPA
ncbi:MAG TPA: hypothetical protein VGK81_07865, partial [Anaerolineae bacterium]